MSFDISKDIQSAANLALQDLIPAKSKKRYEEAYKSFNDWKLQRKVTIINEEIMLAYFYEKSKIWKSSTMWSRYSMIRSSVELHENVDISKYCRLLLFLKRTKDGYVANKSKTLTAENVEKFINDAPDEKYLLMKIVMIFGLNGACRRAEFHDIMLSDIVDNGSIVIVTLRNTKTKKKKNRLFTIGSECNGYNLYKKYANLRPKDITHERFFIFYQNGKCYSQPIGINTFGKIPSKIAEYLHLPDSTHYTGHCLRRTSATFLADSGVDLQVLKRHGGWKSNTVAEGYIDDSISNKTRTSKKIFENISNTIEVCNVRKEETITTDTNNSKTRTSKEIFEDISNTTEACNVNKQETITTDTNDSNTENILNTSYFNKNSMSSFVVEPKKSTDIKHSENTISHIQNYGNINFQNCSISFFNTK